MLEEIVYGQGWVISVKVWLRLPERERDTLLTTSFLNHSFVLGIVWA